MPIASRSFSRGTAAASRDEPQTIAELISRLEGIQAGDHWIVSCYLKLEPRDRTRGKYLIKLKNRVKDQIEWLETIGLERQERETVIRDLKRVQDYVSIPGNLPGGRGIALFACEPIGLFEAIPLPAVFRARLAVARTPLIRELAALDDEFGLVVCVVYDRTGARFFKITAFDVEELPGLVAEPVTRSGRFRGDVTVARPGPAVAAAGEHNFNQRIRSEKHRHYANIAQRLFEITRNLPLRGIVLGAIGTEAAAVRPHLHPYLDRMVMGTARLNPGTVTPAEVREAVLEVRRQAERTWEREHVEALREGLGTGWAVNGVEETLRALSRGQVRTLLVDAEAAVRGWRCGESGRLTVVERNCRGEGEPQPVPDVIDDAIEEALRQRCQVDVVEDSEVRREIDGLAALLRFR
ncbi:MAG: peptide chain release factor 1 [Gemmatimonadales bacterium]|nr:MAG: peptide chain release factor 1 [Gemmatimonadales bacterium]